MSIRTGTEERFYGSERERGVARLMLTVKGEEDVGVHTAQALKFELLSAHRDLASKHLELRAFTSDRGLHLDSTPQQYLHDFGSLLGDDRDGVHRNQVLAALLDDPGLLLRDPGQVGAQVLGVIEADRRDHRNLPVDHVGGVPASAEADLDHGDVDRRLREGRIGHGGEHFELAHRRSPGFLRLCVDHLHVRLDLAERVHVEPRRDRMTVDADPLGRALQMRAGGSPGATMQSRHQRIDHARHRRLTVGSRDVHRRIVVLRRAQDIHERLDASQ